MAKRTLAWALCLAYCITASPRSLPALPACNGAAVAGWVGLLCDLLGPVFSLWLAGELYRPRMRTSAMRFVTGAWLVLGIATIWMFPIRGMGTSVLGMTCLVYGVVQSQRVGYQALITGAGLCLLWMGLPVGRIVAIPLGLASCLQILRGPRGWLYLPGVVVPLIGLGLLHQRISLGTWDLAIPYRMDLSFRAAAQAVLMDPVVVMGCIGCTRLRRMGFRSIARRSIELTLVMAVIVALLLPIPGRTLGLLLLMVPLGLGLAVLMDTTAQWQSMVIAICCSSVLAGFHATRLESFDWGLRQFWWQPKVTVGWLEILPCLVVFVVLGLLLFRTVLRVHGKGSRAVQIMVTVATIVSGVLAARWAVYL